MKGSKLVGLIVVLILVAGVIVAKSTVRKPAGSDDQVQSGAVCPTPVAPRPAAGKAETDPVKEPAPTAQKAAKASPGKPAVAKPAASKALPKMLELGSVGCKPCTYMAPIIDALTQELKGKVTVQFYDVNDNPAMAERYQIQVIPTQIFLDAAGKELFRHVGVFEKEEILARMKELKMLTN
jgi:thioredoxin 1